MPEANDWKQRYTAASAALERASNEHRELRDEVEQAVSRACRTAAGIDVELDSHLDELRRMLRKPTAAAVVAGKLELIDERLRTLLKRRERFVADAAGAVDALLAQLAAQPAPRELRQRIEALRSVARKKLADPHTLPAVIESAVAMHGEMAGADAPPRRAGLLGMLFGDGAPRAASPPPAPPRADGGPPDAATADGEATPEIDREAAHSFDALLDTVEAPASDPGHRPLYEAAKQRLAGGARWSELASLLSDARQLAGAALARGRDEFERYLLGVDERLSGIDAAVQAGADISHRRSTAGAALDSALRSDMASMQDNLASATELEQLKEQVRSRIVQITESMDAFRRNDQELHDEFGSRISELSTRIRQLEEQAREAEARLAEQRRLALTDSLTRLPNREAFARRLDEEFERSRRYGHPLSIGICDIDNFKKVNDSRGHLAGDAVLVAVAQILRTRLRGSDFVARFGGEEFVIMLAETRGADAAAVLEAVRAAIASTSIPLADGGIAVTVCFGVAEFEPADDSLRVFARADGALYQAKRDGRNRVVLYGA